MDPTLENTTGDNSGPIESQPNDVVHPENVDDIVDYNEHDPSGNHIILAHVFNLFMSLEIFFVVTELCDYTCACLY